MKRRGAFGIAFAAIFFAALHFAALASDNRPTLSQEKNLTVLKKPCDGVGCLRVVYEHAQFNIPFLFVLSRQSIINGPTMILLNVKDMTPVPSQIGQPARLGEYWPNLQFSIVNGAPNTNYYLRNFINNLSVNHNKSPDEFDLYYVGPANARVEMYTRILPDGTRVLLECIGDLKNPSVPHPRVCSDRFALNSNVAGVFMRFPYEQLKYIPEIETKIRTLMDSFMVRAR